MEKPMSKIQFTDLKNKIINMHTHTTRCQHAKGTDREYVEKAIEAGYDVLGFSDHAPYVFEDGFVSTIRMTMDELEGYVDSVLSLKKEYASDIDVYCGLEMEYFPNLFDRTMEVIDQYPIDYMILGQHYYTQEAGWLSPKRPWREEPYLELYVERILAGLATDRFFYVAHPDIMCFTGEVELYRKHMVKIVQEMKRRNMPIEINVNGYRDKLHYPNPEFIKLGVENDCDFVIGVDAHKPTDLLDFDTYEKCSQLVIAHGGRLVSDLGLRK